jgi:hypothetical protein
MPTPKLLVKQAFQKRLVIKSVHKRTVFLFGDEQASNTGLIRQLKPQLKLILFWYDYSPNNLQVKLKCFWLFKQPEDI